ncbi:glycosyltransferase family 2 protein [Pelobacter propionicus]|uniref:Glycosyl transferase, family 2 n=1 Tax=Pelobacter propionicus (strain DSM 2379 / NBRC 103807 / OttBd1) TaxID=338966 RepID=A1AUG5_PELPD|nr:glycosyltransferase family 2 protein [Pelobacter propionicus]ABL00986.1 glycosyl transferase, family 2 [Pelobacter propionicus DSM 2379]
MKISVIMSAYNAEKHLTKSIESVLGQTYSDFEFLIVNDASTDDTPALLQKYQRSDNRIALLHNRSNIGLTRSLNLAIQHARHNIIARQDADDISHPERFSKQIDFLKTHGEVMLLGTAGQLIDDSGRILRNEPVISGSVRLKKRLQRCNQFIHGSVMMRRQCLNVIGLYREEFVSAQDYDLFLRISEQYAVDNLPVPLYQYRISPSTVSIAKSRQQQVCALIAQEASRDRRSGMPNNWDQLMYDAYSRRINSKRFHKTIECNLALTKGRNSLLAGEHLTAKKEFSKAFVVRPSLKTLYHLVRSYVCCR